MALQFQPAQRKKTKLRMALGGPAGSGKSWNALSFAHELGTNIGVIDTEHGSISKYQGDAPFGKPWEFQVVELKSFAPDRYIEAIHAAAQYRFDVLIIDSLSHAWSGKDGALDQVDKAAAKSRSNNTYTAWRDVTPQHNALVEAILAAPMHVIATIRAKMGHAMELDERGKNVVRKIGMELIQRNGIEYEFDIVADLDWENRLIVSKSRCSPVANAVVLKPTGAFMQPVKQWLESGAAVSQESIAAAGITYQQPVPDPASNGAATATKSLKEQMAEKKAAAIAQGTGQAPPTEKPAMPQSLVDPRNEARTTDRAIADQVDEIKDAWLQLAELGYDPQAREKALRKRGVETESQLSIDQATTLLANLKGKIYELGLNRMADKTIGTGAEAATENLPPFVTEA